MIAEAKLPCFTNLAKGNAPRGLRCADEPVGVKKFVFYGINRRLILFRVMVPVRAIATLNSSLNHKPREGRLELISGRLTAKSEVDEIRFLWVIAPVKGEEEMGSIKVINHLKGEKSPLNCSFPCLPSP